MNKINTDVSLDKNTNSINKNQDAKNFQSESHNVEKGEMKLLDKKDLSNEILYFSINQESK